MNLQSAAWLVAVVTGVAGWIGGARSKFGAIGQRRRELRLRTWHGYIPRGMISSWYVALAEEPKTPTARVVLEVRQGAPDGKPDVSGAHALRQQIKADGIMARVPTPAEYEFLGDLEKKLGYGKDPEARVIH
ncbi:hypothetical protein ACIRSS_41785 [Amycolatopsis sp. NPDC101161]|uniref:hypothetical protein n=1 Tax=Amycolatopsis sp. NPDC101161 TaxID=3363940 RepID=UPI0038020564